MSKSEVIQDLLSQLLSTVDKLSEEIYDIDRPHMKEHGYCLTAKYSRRELNRLKKQIDQVSNTIDFELKHHDFDDEPAVIFKTIRVKPLAQITASDVPRGLNPEDVATDCE